jgi:hypothetical protein
MEKKLPPDQMELYKRIDEVLFYKWDPIVISDVGWARDEYQSYLPKVFSYAMKSNSPSEIATYLGIVSTESMGLSSSLEHDMKIAKMILEIKKSLGL